MDVERTMEFILEQQARNAVEHVGFERSLKGLRMLVQVGMKMMVKLQEGQKQLQEGQKQLQEGQKQLQKELRDGMREMHVESTAMKADVRALVKAQKKLTDALLRQHTNGRPRKQ